MFVSFIKKTNVARFKENLLRFKEAYQGYINEVIPQLVRAKSVLNPLPLIRITKYLEKKEASPYGTDYMRVSKFVRGGGHHGIHAGRH